MYRSRNLIAAVILGVVFPVIVSAAPASAKLIERGEFHDVFTGVIDDFCEVPGFTVSFENVADGTYSLTSRGRDGHVYYMDHTTSSQTTTNLDNGLSVVDRTRVVDKDLHITDNGDGTLTIVILLTGPSTLYGPDGMAIARNPGQVRFELVVDHAGTPTDPSDDVELSFTQIRESTGRSDNYCAAIVDAIL